MARLIILNGAPGAGKSTIAQRYVDDHPFALDLEPDRLRRQLGRWSADPPTALALTHALVLAAAGTHLRSGHDVVVPQYVGRVEQLQAFAAAAATAHAEYREIVLTDVRDAIIDRFHARNRASTDPVHADAARTLERSGGRRQLEAMYDRLLLVVAARPDAVTVPARTGAIDETYAAVCLALGDQG